MIPVSDALDERALRGLLGAGRALVGHLDLEAVLDRLLGAAAELTGARYAALGVLDRRRERLERFVTRGVREDVRGAIGALPNGHGVLGALIAEARPLRLECLADDPRACGFPPGHPPMRSFLGVPILVGGEAWGSLYLTDRGDGEPFSGADEDAIVMLAAWAGLAIANARTYSDSERRRAELEASTAIAFAASSESAPDRVLDLIVARARDLVCARGVAILLRGDDGLRAAAQAGDLPAAVHGAPVVRGLRASLGLTPAEGVLVPLVHQGRSLGMLAAWGPRAGGDDERLLRRFAVHAAAAVANARTVEARRLREALYAAEAERTRWARELHDSTLQGLGALRLLLVAARRRGDPERLAGAVDGAIERLEDEIDGLRGMVRELRPAALDELGLGPALEGLAARTPGVAVRSDVRVSHRLAPDLETAVYRIAQEALNNAVRHADPSAVAIAVRDRDGEVEVEVRDDGHGFDADAPVEGFGLTGMRERVALLDGALDVDSSPAGTRVTAVLPDLNR